MSNGTPPRTLQDWVRYLHMARAVPQNHPDYPQAQEAVRFALQRIRNLNTAASSQEQGAAEQGKPIGPLGAAGAGLMHGLSLGAGEPIAGLLAALIPGGQGFGEGAAQYRQGLENIGLQYPTATPAGEVAGLALQSAVPITQAVGAGTATAASIPSTRAGIVSRFLTGAGQTNVTPGLTMGAIQGFSAGGEDPGDLRARATGAGVGAGVGAAGAAALGGLGALRVPRWLNTVKREIRQSLPKNTPKDVVEGMTEAGIRQQLTRQGFDAPTQDRILATWRAGKTVVPPPPPPTPPPTVRPGETIAPTPSLEKATFLRRGSQVRQEVSPVSGTRRMSFTPGPDIGTGQTLPYYPRGGQVEQAFGAPPVASTGANLAPQQLTLIQQFLQGATPADLGSRLNTIRALGIPVPPDAETQLLPLLLRGP